MSERGHFRTPLRVCMFSTLAKFQSNKKQRLQHVQGKADKLTDVMGTTTAFNQIG